METPAQSGAASLQPLASLASRLARAPMAAASLLHGDRLSFRGSVGLPAPRVHEGEILLSETFCKRVVELGEPFVVEDARSDPEMRELRTIREFGAVSYAGVPVVAPGGEVLGTLCVMDRVPRRWTPEEVQDLQHLAQAVLTSIQFAGESEQRAHLEQALRQKEELLAQMAESIDQVFWAVNLAEDWKDSRIVYLNSAFERIFERSIESVYADPWSSVADAPEEDRQRILESFQGAVQGEGSGARYRLVLPSGIKWIHTRYFPARDPTGRIYRVVGLSQEITERVRAEEALRQRERQLAEAQAVAHLGSWEWYMATDTVTWSNELYRIFGLSEQEFRPTYEGFLELVAPEDREWVRTSIHQGLESGSFEYVCRFIRPTGELRYKLSRGAVVRDELGKPIRVIGTAMDITERKQAEEEVRTTKAHLEHLLLHSPAVLYSAAVDGDYGATYISPNIRDQLGYAPEDFTGDSAFWVDHIHPDDREQILSGLSALFETGHQTHEYRFRHRDGSWRWMRDEMRLLHDESGSPREILGYWTDITGRKEAEERLRESEQQHRILFESNPNPMWVYDPETLRILGGNESTLRFYGYTCQEVLSMSIHDLRPEEDRPELERILREIKANDGPAVHQARHRTKDGEIRDVIVTGNAISFRDRPARLVVVHDITERRRIENALRESEERFRQLAENIQEVFWLADVDTGHLPYVSPVYRKVWGRDPEEVYGNSLSWFDAIHEDDRDHVRRLLDPELLRRNGFEAEYRIRRPDGEIRWIHSRGFPVRNESGEVYRLAGIAKDITDRREIEEALRQRERQLAEAQAIAHLGSWEWYMATDTVTWSDEMYRIYGVSEQEFTPTFQGFLERVHPEDRERVRAVVLEGVIRGSFEHVYRFVRPSGEVRYELAHGVVVRDEQGNPVRMVGTGMDITERRHAEEALLESSRVNARFATAVENLSTGVVITDPHLPDNPIVYANPGFVGITGYLESEILGRNARFLQGPGTQPALLQDIRRAIEERRSFKGRILNYRKDGTPFWNEMTISPVLDPEGRLINFVGLQSDVTEQVQAEETIQTQLTEKTALLAEVHHRVKNNLQIISSMLNMQVRALEDPQAIAALQESRGRIHAIALAHETLYRTQSFAGVNLAQYLRTLAQQLQRSHIAGRQIELMLDLQSCQVPLTQAVPCGLLASELISNALKHAFPERQQGEILLAVRTEGNTGTLIVSDNGAGLPDGLDLGSLRSVGLQLVQAFTHQLGGTLDLRRQPGTTFAITFPVEDTAG